MHPPAPRRRLPRPPLRLRSPPTAVSTATVKLSGTAKVGSTLVATTSGFTKPTSFSYLWSVGGVATDIDDGSYVVQPGDVTKVVTVTVTNTLRDDSVEVASAKSAAVTQDPVFVDAAGKPVTAGLDPDGERFALDTTAGEAFSYTFRATGSPAPTFALAWAYPDEAEDDGEEPEGTPDDQLPDGITFDAATGVLSGTTEDALYSEFAVTATSGGTTVTQYVELNVDAAAAAGVQVFSADRASFLQYIKSGIDDGGPTDGTLTSWIIDARGHVTTEIEKYHFSSDSWESETTDIDGGRPTVKQGGTLLVNGDLVDRFGNTVTDEDGNSPELAITSDIASDVVREDPDLGDYGNFLNVTFPHASVHNLTAAAGDFATSFAVEVVPTATAPVAAPPGGHAPRWQPRRSAPSRSAPPHTRTRMAAWPTRVRTRPTPCPGRSACSPPVRHWWACAPSADARSADPDGRLLPRPRRSLHGSAGPFRRPQVGDAHLPDRTARLALEPCRACCTSIPPPTCPTPAPAP
ncbi:Ig domain-containing protein [Curtobacterium sp. MCPF17_052]|uniref:Ig domain-containing protein n=1 Tax=Curtobacterium sp. MCPF17_052 TaxID=2175655 RepID=UPI0024E03EB1|nr:putative Ig domain-containing protein [Curtobacterium sp. MCPF17_052]WIB12354.1 putative Ig domain-containing protein [Curtobacterium sp. MCPF17_052]